ncbi:GGDEF domain-containing response regulator [Maribrevibacterium harenarium]|nr:diguanylate cyclase [Maribrevibacterium harenarium]
MDKMKVIIAEDDLTTRLLLDAIVSNIGFQTIPVTNGREAWEAYIKLDEPCVLLLDWDMPEINGHDLACKIKNHAHAVPPYIILITGRNDSTDVVKGLEDGADDYICKPFNAPELEARINVGKRTISLHRQLHETKEILQYQATHDSLTGLHNRRALLDLLSQEVKRAHRLNMNLHVAMCDVDFFKHINDSYGHFKGDEVLKSVADSIKQSLREYDLVGRYGGDEFVIAFSSFQNSAMEIFERIRMTIAGLQFNCNETQTGDISHFSLTTSMGVSSFSHANLATLSLDEMLKTADEQLYEAKTQGRNQVICQFW